MSQQIPGLDEVTTFILVDETPDIWLKAIVYARNVYNIHFCSLNIFCYIDR
jgi:hypothetical protein